MKKKASAALIAAATLSYLSITAPAFASVPVPVPEPGTIGLFGLALAGLGVLRRRRRPQGEEARLTGASRRRSWFHGEECVMKRTILAAVAVTAVVVGWATGPAYAGASLPPTVTITETVTGTGGTYNVSISSETNDWYLVGFAVSNNTATGISTSRSGWATPPDYTSGGTLLNSTAWDEGFEITVDESVAALTSDLGTFSDLFGDAGGAALFWLADTLSGTPIGPDESSSQFEWFESFAASTWVAAVEQCDGEVCSDAIYLQGSTESVPEPATAGLIGLALAGIGFLRRRRR